MHGVRVKDRRFLCSTSNLIYARWRAMVRRCSDPRVSDYARYGGRGIRWLTFANYVVDISELGPRPSSRHSLDRINNDGNYEPGNVRWATHEEQVHNRRNAQFVIWNGERLPLAEAAAKAGLRCDTVWHRLRAGWSVEEALSRTSRRGAHQ